MSAGAKKGGVPLRDWIAVYGAILGAFMAVLDIQITNSALKYIQGGIAASLDEGTWISTSYLVAEIVTIPLTGYLSGVLGLRRYLLVNAVLFVIFSMCCGFATSLTEMIVFRAAQGFTGGVMIPTALTIVNLKLPQEKRAIGMAMFGLTATLGPALGPTLGGWLTDNFGWQYIFYINLVPGILLCWMIWHGMDPEKMHLDRLKHGDWLGIAAMAIGLGSLEVVLEEGERLDWFGSELILGLAVVAAVFTSLFIAIELMRKEPFIDLRLLGRGSLGAACIVGLSLGFGLFGSIYIIPVYLGQIQGYDASQIGHVIMWLGLPQLFVFPFVPFLMKRVDPRLLLAFGLVAFAASSFMNAYMSAGTAEPELRLPMLIRALGQPFIITPITQMATAGMARNQAAGASSLFNIMRNLGGSIGIAMLQTFTTIREHFHFSVIAERIPQNSLLLHERLAAMAQVLAPGAPAPSLTMPMALAELQNLVRRDATVMAYSDCFFIMGVVLLASVLAIFFLKKPPMGRRAPG